MLALTILILPTCPKRRGTNNNRVAGLSVGEFKADKSVSCTKVEESENRTSLKHNNATHPSTKTSFNFVTHLHQKTQQISIIERKTNVLCDNGASISCCNKAFLHRLFQVETEISLIHIQTVVEGCVWRTVKCLLI